MPPIPIFNKLTEEISDRVEAKLQSLVDLTNAYANSDTDTDIPGAETGERGAKFWAISAEGFAEDTASTLSSSIIQSDAILVFQAQGEAVNGASLRTGGNPPILLGITIPSGQTGQGSYTVYHQPVADFAIGTRLRFTSYLTTSDDLLSTLNFAPGVEIRGTQGSAQQVPGSTSVIQTSSNILRLRGDYVVQGDPNEMMGLLMQIGSTTGGGSAEERSWEHLETFIEVIDSDGVNTPNSISLRASRPITDEKPAAVEVKVGPGGDWPGVLTGLRWSLGRSSDVMGKCLVSPGVYTTNNAVLPPFVKLCADGPRESRPRIATINSSNTSKSTIINSQPLWMNDSSILRGIHLYVINGRYALHSDSGSSNRHAIQLVEDCIIENVGNEGAATYWDGVDGTGGQLRSFVSALGGGLHSGQEFTSRRNSYISPDKPFSWHDSINWEKDARIVSENDTFISTGTGSNRYDLNFQCQGSMRRMVCDFYGPILTQPINIDNGTGWLNSDLNCQPANRMQITVNVWGPRSHDWTSTQPNASCLELRGPSNSAATRFALSGTAAPILFGALPDYRVCRGATSRTAAYSQHAITSEIVAGTGLPARLGDLTSAALTLTIAGPVVGTIVLDENYGAMTNNTAVVAALNAKLTAAGLTTLTFYVSTPYEDIADVRFPDVEVLVKNIDTVTIARGNAVAMNTKRGEVKLTTSVTSANEFVGISVEDIAPGAWGRVLRPNRGGVISQSHLALSGLGTPTVGDILFISATAGALSPVAGSSNVPVLRCVETGRTSRPFTRWEFI